MSLLEFLRLLVSKDTRETAKEVLRLVKRSPEWKKDIVLLEGKFPAGEEEHAKVMTSQAMRLLASKKFGNEQIQRARFVSLELIRNAFEHGLKRDQDGQIQVRIEVSSDFYRIGVTDPGSGFDLAEELSRQGAKDKRSERCRALGFIYRMVSDLSQDVSGGKHTVTALIRKGENPCEIERVGDVTIFRFKGEMQLSGYFWAEITREIEELPRTSRAVLDFAEVNEVSTRLLSEIVMLLRRYERMERTEREPGAMDFLDIISKVKKKPTVVVSGIGGLDYILREFLTNRFMVFPDVDGAIEYLSTS
jgi:anti-sigma regulatory factor (Ser/Thr protein kinase)